MTLAETSNSARPGIVAVPANERGTHHINVGETERLISLGIGVPVVIFGMTRGLLKGLLPSTLGTALIVRGVTGHSFLYQAIGVSTVEQGPAAVSALPNEQGIAVKRAVTINSSAQDLYNHWHDFESAPMYMRNVESVQQTGDKRWRWVAQEPLGIRVEWEAETTEDVPGRAIAWRTVQGTFLAPGSGSVRFEQKPNSKETIVRLEIDYYQFRGPIGTALGNILGQIPEQQARKDLRHFKELLEAGEIPTTKGQPTGRR